MLLKHVKQTLPRKRLRKNIIHSCHALVKSPVAIGHNEHTVLEVELNVVASNVGGHGNDRGSVKLANEVAGRYTIQVGHYDIHQDQVVL